MTITLLNLRPIALAKRSALLLAALLQVFCSAVFVVDLVSEWKGASVHSWAEALAVIALLVGAALALREFQKLLRRNRRVERELHAASGAFQAVIEQHFELWGLTKAEKDVALLSIKGISIGDIARMRATREGTIKSQSAAIYRKAGVSSRADLISAVIEDLIGGLSLARQSD